MSERDIHKYYSKDPFFLEVKKAYQRISKIIKEYEITDPANNKEFAAFVYVALSAASHNFDVYEKDCLVDMIEDLFNKTYHFVTKEFLEERNKFYLDIIFKKQTRWEWNEFQPINKHNGTFGQIVAIFGDILVNPECVNDYQNAPVVIGGFIESWLFKTHFLSAMIDMSTPLNEFYEKMPKMKQTQIVFYRSAMSKDERKVADAEEAKKTKPVQNEEIHYRAEKDKSSSEFVYFIRNFFSNLVSSYGGIWYYLLISAATLVPIIALGANIVISIFFYIFAITVPFVNVLAWIISLPMIILQDQGSTFEIIYWLLLGITAFPMIKSAVKRLSSK